MILYQDFNAGALSIANLFKELTEISKAAKNPAQKCFPVLSFIWLPLRRDFFKKFQKILLRRKTLLTIPSKGFLRERMFLTACIFMLKMKFILIQSCRVTRFQEFSKPCSSLILNNVAFMTTSSLLPENICRDVRTLSSLRHQANQTVPAGVPSAPPAGPA